MKHNDIIKVNGIVGKAVETSGGIFRFWDCEGTYYSDNLPIIESYEETTLQEKIDLIIKKFSWGAVTGYECINNGEYLILEFIRNSEEEKSYHPYMNFRDTNHTFPSLDHAIVGCIALKRDGVNTQAHKFFMKMTNNSDIK